MPRLLRRSTMKSLIVCVLLIASTLAFTIPNPALTRTAVATSAKGQDHKVEKRFTSALLDSMMDDDDYFDEADLPPVFGRRRRPSRRTLQLAQMMRQLAGPQGLTREQMQNMQQNLQNLQLLQNMQQMMQPQNLQG